MDWTALKQLVVDESALSRDALHILAGVGGQVLVALLTRRGLAHPLPWLTVFAAALINEYFDLTEGDVWDRPMWPGSVRDLVLTMALPTLFLLLTRLAPSLFAPAEKTKRP